MARPRAAEAPRAPERAWRGRRFEYKLVLVHGHMAGTVKEMLDEDGADGWEAVLLFAGMVLMKREVAP